MILFFDLSNGISGDMTIASLLDTKIVSEKKFLSEMNKVSIASEFEFLVRLDYKNDVKCTKIGVLDNNELMQRFSGKTGEHHHNSRNLEDVLDIINKSKITDNAKNIAKKMFVMLAEAEAKAHKTTVDKVHFHEVGAVDSIVDIIGTSILIDLINPAKIVANRINVGSGKVVCSHGEMSVPTPATKYLLAGLPTYSDDRKTELTTPTGATILKSLVDEYIEDFDGDMLCSGFGGGEKNFDKYANVLKVVAVNEETFKITKKIEMPKIEVVEEIIGDVEKLEIDNEKQQTQTGDGVVRRFSLNNDILNADLTDKANENIKEVAKQLEEQAKKNENSDNNMANVPFENGEHNHSINEPQRLRARHLTNVDKLLSAIDKISEKIEPVEKDDNIEKMKTVCNTVVEINVNIDNSTGEELGFLAEKLFDIGAFDVYFQPIFMKKFRPAYKLGVIADENDLNKIAEVIFNNCGTIGLRYTVQNRITLDREIVVKDTPYGKVRFKRVKGKMDVPEYEDVKKIATERKLSIKEVVKVLLSQEGDSRNEE